MNVDDFGGHANDATDKPQKVCRWEPLPDIPETPCSDFSLESLESSQITLTLRYSEIVENDDRDLAIVFADVLAFRTQWDGDAPVVGKLIDCRRCKGGRFSQFIWPLLIVENSQWLAGGDFDTSRFIATAMKKKPWQQFTFLTLERSVDILARGAISARWIAAA